jgi:hypothetical protein
MIFAGLVYDQVKLTNYVLLDSTDKKEFGHFCRVSIQYTRDKLGDNIASNVTKKALQHLRVQWNLH